MDEKKLSGRELLFTTHGIPPMGASLSLAFQHLVAMIVGCVTPAIIVANAAGLDMSDRVILIQASLVVSAISTFLQIFPIGGKKGGFRFGSGLPVIIGVSFAYVPSMQAIAGAGEGGHLGVASIAGAMLVGGAVAVIVGLFLKKIRKFFPPIITGTVVFTIGLSLYPTAINYMAGGTSNTYELVVQTKGLTEALVYGSWQNWVVALLTLAMVVFLSNYTKGITKWTIVSEVILGLIFAVIVTLFFIAGLAVGQQVVDAIPAWLNTGLSQAGNMMKFVGFAILLKIMMSRDMWGFFFMGFGLALIATNIPAISGPALLILTLIGFGVAFWDFQQQTELKGAVADGGDMEDGI